MLPGQKSYERDWVIGDEIWEVKFVRGLSFGSLGMCCPETRTISIKQKQKNVEILKTFFHEVCHGLEFAHDIELPHSTVYDFEEAWAKFFVDNWENLAKLIVKTKAVK